MIPAPTGQYYYGNYIFCVYDYEKLDLPREGQNMKANLRDPLEFIVGRNNKGLRVAWYILPAQAVKADLGEQTIAADGKASGDKCHGQVLISSSSFITNATRQYH